VLERLRRVAVNLQPCQRFVKRPAVHKNSACARGEMQVHQAALQGEDMPQTLDVAAREREQAE